MAIVKKLERINLERDSSHSEVDCTYSIIHGPVGKKFDFVNREWPLLIV
jgi:hypothetical protein